MLNCAPGLWHLCLQELRQLLHQHSSASSAALDAERTAAAQQADECAAVAAASAQAASAAALHAAEVRGALLEGQLDSVERERDALARQVGVVCSGETIESGWWGDHQQAPISSPHAFLRVQVTALQTQVDDLQAARDVSAATISSLEATLAAIERAEARRTQAQGSIKRTNSTTTAAAAAAAGVAGGDGGGGSGASSRRASRSNSIGASAAASRQLSPREGRTEPHAGAAVPSADPAAAAERMDRVEDGSAAAAGGSGSGSGSGSAAALSKELVKAHTATADAQRKLRVSAR